MLLNQLPLFVFLGKPQYYIFFFEYFGYFSQFLFVPIICTLTLNILRADFKVKTLEHIIRYCGLLVVGLHSG